MDLVPQETQLNDLPLLPLKDVVIFPGTHTGLAFGRELTRLAIEESLATNNLVVFVTQRDPDVEDVGPDDMYEVGTLGIIRQVLRSDSDVKVVAEGLSRVKIVRFTQEQPYYRVNAERLPAVESENATVLALKNNLTSQLKSFVALRRDFDMQVLINILSTGSAHRLVDLIASQIGTDQKQKQDILEETSLEERLGKTNFLLAQELQVAELEQQLNSQTQEELSKMQKEVYLREQMKTIQKELGEGELGDLDDLERQIKEKHMPKEVEERVTKELNRLRSMPSMSPEVGYIRNYLDLVISLPWEVEKSTPVDLQEAQTQLDADHYGLPKVKDRILEYLAVHQLTGKIRGPILCFYGPPGVGKTSIGRSIAKALDRKFVKMSLGGVHDEAEIRGHRRTYVGAMPGRIIQGINQAKSKNPVFMLDEIDKVGSDFRGDPSSALLEALDPEQNFAFSDHYLEVPYDLSDVLFIATANVLESIPGPLRDRMEIIHFPSYTAKEKIHIAKNHLLNKVREAAGLTEDQMNISESVIEHIIEQYTQEAGVRDLERQLSAVARKVAKQVAEGSPAPGNISIAKVNSYLGPSKIDKWLKETEDQVGLVAGLAVTPFGGEVLSVEATLFAGKGNLQLTGSLGDVMKESVQAALSYARSHADALGIAEKSIHKDIHIHVPSGAIPKDGPSAGVAMATAITSALTGIPVRSDVAMTGEVTLRGRVMRIGGVKEKVMAAQRAGLTTILLPKSNEVDVDDIPEEVRKKVKLIFVEDMEEVLKTALARPLKPRIRTTTSSRPNIAPATS
jgi:ATP-dependent Lon protease